MYNCRIAVEDGHDNNSSELGPISNLDNVGPWSP